MSRFCNTFPGFLKQLFLVVSENSWHFANNMLLNHVIHIWLSKSHVQYTNKITLPLCFFHTKHAKSTVSWKPLEEMSPNIVIRSFTYPNLYRLVMFWLPATFDQVIVLGYIIYLFILKESDSLEQYLWHLF